MMTVVYMDSKDIIKLLFLFKRRKETARLVLGNGQLIDKVVTINFGGASAQIAQKFYFAGDIASAFKIDTREIADFDENAVIEKVIDGPLGFVGIWNAVMVIMALAPTLYSRRDSAIRALAQTSIADYPSRKEVQIKKQRVSLLKFVPLIFLYRSFLRGTNI